MGKIIIDITELAQWQGRLTGVPRVMSELSRRFASQDNTEFVMWDGQKFQKAEARRAITNEPVAQPAVTTDTYLINKLKALKRRSRLLQKGFVVAKGLKAGKTEAVEMSSAEVVPKKGDILFILADWHGEPTFIDAVVKLKNLGVKLAQISYDLLPLVTPQYSGHATERLGNYLQKIYPLCDVIFSISQHTKADITAWLKRQGLAVPTIEVIRLGDDFKQAAAVKPKDTHFSRSVQDKAFVLCVGTIEARKNHALLYYTYKLAIQQGVDLPTLVIVGRRGWLSDDIYEIMTTDPETKDKFIFLQAADDEELAWLYKNCLFSVYPSFYEGWGLPIAESIAYGVPCIASNTSSMPEIAGDLISYFNPSSVSDCLAALQKLLDPKQLSQAKEKIKNYKPTTWDQTYQSVEQSIERLHD